MASFFAKQIFGKKIESFKDKLDDNDNEEKSEEASKEQIEACKAYERDIEERHQRHLKFEEDREKMRQRIRDKYGIPKRDYSSDNGHRNKLKAASMSESTAAVAEKMEEAESSTNSFLPKSAAELLEKAESKTPKDCVLQ